MITAKTALRRCMRQRRRALAETSPDAAQRAAALLPLERLPPFRVVGGYRPIGAELDPGPVLARLAAAGARVALPAVIDAESPLIFRTALWDQPMTPDALGVPSPTAAAETVIPDLVIAPLLAFDRAGGRLGQGAGAFDRTLAALRAEGSVFVIGLAFSGQEAARVPLEPHDQPLDAILTETGYIVV